MLLLLFLQTACAFSIGDRISRGYTVYDPMPVNSSNATSVGWSQSGPCQNHLGIPYNYRSTTGPQESYPLTLYFSTSGDVTGIAVTVYGGVEKKLLDLGYFVPDGDGHRITVTFSRVDSSCGTQIPRGSLGDTLIINAHTIAKSLPVRESDAIAQKWHIGSCFETMGHHYFYDLESAPNMSWKSENLLPVVLMFDKGLINAFFFCGFDDSARNYQSALVGPRGPPKFPYVL